MRRRQHAESVYDVFERNVVDRLYLPTSAQAPALPVISSFLCSPGLQWKWKRTSVRACEVVTYLKDPFS
jgi:hypothetical protein